MADQVRQRIQALQVTVGAMAFGVTVLSVVAVALSGQFVAGGGDLETIFCAILVGLAVVELVAYSILRPAFTARAQREWVEDGPPQDQVGEFTAGRYATLTIIGCAMAEGFGLLGGAAVLVTGRYFGLAAAGVALVALAIQFPTRAKMSTFASRITGQLEQL